ncbi:MAG: hypothetical protein JWO74_4908 [Solirubrobacterales bacterium]|nr:hypothetical protein [Solirubrobacterales bacterium]
MKPTGQRLMGVATLLSAIAIAAPVSAAGAATAARPTDTVIGATYITSAPTTFVNTNNQTSPGSNTLGDQVAS